MPIGAADFDLARGTENARAFLARNDRLAFRLDEIAAAVHAVPPEAVTNAMLIDTAGWLASAVWRHEVAAGIARSGVRGIFYAIRPAPEVPL